MPTYTNRPNTQLDAESERLYQQLKDQALAVLCGRNNSGKSFLLRRLVRDVGVKAFYLGPARYFNFTAFSAYGPEENRKERDWNNFMQNVASSNTNIDNSPLDLPRAIAELNNEQRSKLLELLDRLLRSKTIIELTMPSNDMSQKYVSVDGFNLAFQSSGFRLAATLLTCLLDVDYKTFVVDEPELGLSPEIQGVIADFIQDPTQRKQYFPHLEHVVLATHSPIYLDRKCIQNNYYVSRTGELMKLEQLQTVQQLNSLQFQLLGNRFETLHLPSAIILVEGVSDYVYVRRLVHLKFPNHLVSVICCNSDSRMNDVLTIAKQMLGEIQKSPYSNRMFAILDKVHGPSVKAKLIQQGIPENQIITWNQNGIEHYYPSSLMDAIYGIHQTLLIQGDDVSANGLTIRKKELAEKIVNMMNGSEQLPEELVAKLLNPLAGLLA